MKESQANFAQILKWISTGEIKHYIHRKYPLHRGAEAIQDLMDRKVLGKMLLLWIRTASGSIKNNDYIFFWITQLPLAQKPFLMNCWDSKEEIDHKNSH